MAIVQHNAQDDDGNTQWDLVGYYEYDGEYVYYEDVETEMNTRAIEEVRELRLLPTF
jgi:hypothetical protein